MSTKAWDDLAAAIGALGPPTGSSEAKLRPVLDALKALADSEGSGPPIRTPSIEESDED